ncbi:MAG: zinc-ribbon domain-containing protein [Gemmatimonadota bacterium]|jgi:predicted Zn finger-like uncharacterized protein
MNIRCPQCDKVYRVDPQRVPAGGVRTRCEACGTVFFLGAEGAEAVAPASTPPGVVPEEPTTTLPSPEPAPAPASPEPPRAVEEPAPRAVEEPVPPAVEEPAPPVVFGPQDPETRARRLARALVSDIVVYHPDRRARSLKAGNVRMEFREEILKSWDEYVEQVGEEMAKKTPFFRDALNEILAKGQKVF